MEEYVIKLQNEKYFNTFTTSDEQIVIFPVDIMQAQKFESFQSASDWMRNLIGLSNERAEFFKPQGVYKVVFETNIMRALEEIKFE